jgi:hypothetical protein
MQMKQAARPNDQTLISITVGKVFWHVTPYSLVENTNASDKTFCLHHQSRATARQREWCGYKSRDFLIIKPIRCTDFSNLFWKWNSTCFGQRNSPKHVEFHFQNKFEKLVHLVGFIIRKFVTMHGHMNVKKQEERQRNGGFDLNNGN